MLNKEVTFSTHRFKGVIILNTIFCVLLIAAYLKNTLETNKFIILIVLSLLLRVVFEIVWLLFGKITLKIENEILFIQKSVLGIKILNKKINSPFQIEYLGQLRSPYFWGAGRMISFYYDRGLRVLDIKGKELYSVELKKGIDFP